MKTRIIITIAAALLVSGCSIAPTKLPEVSGELVEYRRTDPLGGTTITAKGVDVTEHEVRADEVTWDTRYPTWNVYLSVKGYKRQRSKE